MADEPVEIRASFIKAAVANPQKMVSGNYDTPTRLALEQRRSIGRWFRTAFREMPFDCFPHLVGVNVER
ncbi:MAG: hypothetical protein JO008_05095 [Alphaproteobacteria bacterium]|nr:hypothetical protein [Alphaproteobacteria bacterium]